MAQHPTLIERFRGALVGTAVGDALGAPFEGQRRVKPAAVERWAQSSEPLRWTDDTAMTIGVAESLIAVGGFDGEDLARRFADHHAAEPWRGYGAGPPQIFAALRAGASWDAPARELFGGSGSFGNGAAMRVAPAGLFAHRDPDAAVALARDTALVTHAHELARQGAALQAYGVAWLSTAEVEGRTWTAAMLLDALDRVAPAQEYRVALDVVRRLEEADSAAASIVVEEIGNGIAASEAVPAALHAMLANVGSFPGAVSYAVSLGGDTDTIAAMAGALSGALHGHEAIPAGWLTRLERHDDLVALADALLRASQGAAPNA